MHICLDIDDTITYAPKLFTLILAAAADARVTVVTFRADEEGAKKTLVEHAIRFDQLIVSTDPQFGKTPQQSLAEWKADVVNRLMPDWFFEDMPEVIARVHPEIKVFMPCDEVMRQWMSDVTG